MKQRFNYAKFFDIREEKDDIYQVEVKRNKVNGYYLK